MTDKQALRYLSPVKTLMKRLDFDKHYIEALETAMRALKAERPQGEWIAREDMDYLDENKVFHKHFQCNKCGLIHDFIDWHTAQYNFCPQCGAKMKGGAI